MNNSIEFLINEESEGKRLDIFLSDKINDLTRSNVKKLILTDLVKINKKTVNSPSKKIKVGDKILIKLTNIRENKLLPKSYKLLLIICFSLLA